MKGRAYLKAIKKQSFMEGAAVLVIAHLVVKIIGACFKIPLANILHETGMAYFSRAYNLYAAIFVMATAGLPVAVSKMVSESLAKKNYAESKKILYSATVLLTIIGALGTAVLFFGARFLCSGSPGSYLSIVTISPALLFIAILSAFRGYFQGHSNMIPTAYSEVIEAVSKLVIGLLGAYLLMSVSSEVAAAGAISGVTIGGLLALLFLVYFYYKNRNSNPLTNATKSRKMSTIIARLLLIAVPITIGAAVMSLTNVIDTFMINLRLSSITVDEAMFKTLTEFFGVSATDVIIGENITSRAADVMYGSYSGYAMSLFNLPPSIVTSISMSIVPAISAALAIKDRAQAKLLTESSIRITTMFALPCAIGLSVLSSPILICLYNNARAENSLALLSLSIIFVCIVSVTTSILQASGKVFIPVIHMLIGGVVKAVSNYFLIAVPALNIGGAPISTFLCYFIIATLNISAVMRVIKPEFNIKDFIIKPLISAVVMGVVVFSVYNLAALVLGCPQISLNINFLTDTAPVTPVLSAVRLKTIIALGVSILVGVIAYVITMGVVSGFFEDDIKMLPKGTKICKLMKKIKLLK